MALFRTVGATAKIKEGTFTHNGTTADTIYVGFAPKKVILYHNVAGTGDSAGNNTVRVIYDEDESKLMYDYTTNAGTDYLMSYAMPATSFAITNNGFTFNAGGSSYAGDYKYIAIG